MFDQFFRKILDKFERAPEEPSPSSSEPAYQVPVTSDPCASTDMSGIVTSHLSPEDIETFDRDGVVCLRNVLSPEDIAALRGDIEQQLSQNPPSGSAIDLENIRKEIWGETEDGKALTSDDFFLKNKPDRNNGAGRNGEVQEMQAVFEPQYSTQTPRTILTTQSSAVRTLKQILGACPSSRPNIDPISSAAPAGQFYVDIRQWPHFKNITNIALNSVLPEICAALLKSKKLQFWGDTTRVKTPNTAQRTSLHQDWAYFPITGLQSCSVWIALDPSTPKNGVPYYIKKSHKGGQTFASNIIIASTQNPLSLYAPLPETEYGSDHVDSISFNVEPGDIIIHHVLTLHGAPGNISLTDNRRALTLRYCGDDIRFFNKPGALDTYKVLPPPQDGDRLNPEIFPTAWPKRAAGRPD